MIQPLDTISFSLHTNPGVYALLIGSGVSRAAGIPTGWEITLDLVREVAVMQTGKTPENLEAWWQDLTGEEPSYSKLLKELARSPPERRQLLHKYFEPNEKEREEGKKKPTRAHQAIAELVENRVVRVILTTNFDRLIEQALEKRGVTHKVISTHCCPTNFSRKVKLLRVVGGRRSRRVAT